MAGIDWVWFDGLTGAVLIRSNTQNAADVEEGDAVLCLEPQPNKKVKKRKRPREGEEDGGAAPAPLPTQSPPSNVENRVDTGDGSGGADEDYSTASPNELWCPTVRIDMEALGLPWWGGAKAALAPAPRFPPLEPR